MELNEKRVQQQIRNFEKAISAYTGQEPLTRFLTRYYKENKQMGSSDRRMTSRLCYNYFRIGDWKKGASPLDRVVHAEYLCEQESSMVQLLAPELHATIERPLPEKIALIHADMHVFFPLVNEISDVIDKQEFLVSQLIQPDLFVRLKRGNERAVLSELEYRQIPFKQLSEQAVALPNGAKLQEMTKVAGLYEIQDLSSQRTLDDIEALKGEKWWDACAASGGKALLFLDKYPHIDLLVSDIRLSILRNLDERFEKARITVPYRKKIIDLTQDVHHILQGELFDGIILDAPCSGSGTWGRTPEMKAQFSEEKLRKFSTLQRTIASNVVQALKPGKSLTYITCSVYKSENEDVVDYLVSDHGMAVDKMHVLHGYREKADTMFVARLVKRQ